MGPRRATGDTCADASCNVKGRSSPPKGALTDVRFEAGTQR